MNPTDAQELVSYLIGSFAVGYLMGLLVVWFSKVLDQI